MDKEFAKAILGSLLRWLLASAFGYLVKEGALTGDQVDMVLGALAAGLVSLGWAVWQKYRTKILLRFALDMPAGSTHEELKEVAAKG